MAVEKHLLAGPWVGEFGWELFAWQAYIRSLSEHYDKTTIICRPSSHAIYSDFADEYIYFNPTAGQADSFFMHGLDFQESIRKILSSGDILTEGASLLVPRRIGWPPHTHWSEGFTFGEHVIKPRYINFSQTVKEQPVLKYDYIFHARNRKLRKADNWSIANWERLRDLIGPTLGGGSIACIGTATDSVHIEGTDDLRDMDLSTLFKVLSMAKGVFGPSSGPMHLASLCGAPHIVWSHSGNRDRYERNWNPLKTPILFLDEWDWHPTPEDVWCRFFDWEKP